MVTSGLTLICVLVKVVLTMKVTVSGRIVSTNANTVQGYEAQFATLVLGVEPSEVTTILLVITQ